MYPPGTVFSLLIKILSKNFLSIFSQKYILVFAILHPHKLPDVRNFVIDFPSIF
ncbi:hypothetical protein JavanS327_0009 [Streptococcus satellite phage Javan327]|nr:hypothetical protein JavanS327_0009 [Streptococcus satellite phage Javan327]